MRGVLEEEEEDWDTNYLPSSSRLSWHCFRNACATSPSMSYTGYLSRKGKGWGQVGGQDGGSHGSGAELPIRIHNVLYGVKRRL